MLTYAGVAAASKAFSATSPGRRLHRRLGNVAVERMRVVRDTDGPAPGGRREGVAS